MTSAIAERAPQQTYEQLHEGALLGGEFVVGHVLQDRENSILYLGHDRAGEEVVIKAAQTPEVEHLIRREQEVAAVLADEVAALTPEAIIQDGARTILVTPFQEGGDLSGVLDKAEQVKVEPVVAEIDHKNLQGVIQDVEADVEFLEATDGSVDKTAPIIQELTDALARQEQLPREIAQESDEITVESILQEVKEAADRLFGVDVDRDGYIVNKVALKLLQKADALDAKRFQEVHQLPEKDEIQDRLAMVDAVATAVEAMHRKGFVHLDIKEANVLLNRKGNVKLTDFGSAKKLGALVDVAMHAGTPGNIPPELYGSSRPGGETIAKNGRPIALTDAEKEALALTYNESMDVYGLSALAFKAVTGVVAYDPGLMQGDAVAARAVLEHLTGNISKLEEQVEKGLISHELGELIVRGLSSDPEQRPTVAEIKKALAV